MKTQGIRYLMTVLLVFGSTLAFSAEQPSMAPVNPEFVKAMQIPKDKNMCDVSYGVHPLGHTASPLLLPQMSTNTTEVILPGETLNTDSYKTVDDYAQSKDNTENNANYPVFTLKANTSIPSSYDLRNYGRVTSVKDQGSCGSCWTFGTMSALESAILVSTQGKTTYNFSEQHLNKYHGFAWSECNGGNHTLAAAYLARWSGPYLESAFPYPYSGNSAILGATATVQKHIQDIRWLPDRGTNYTDNNAIKQAIMSYGAVDMAFGWDDAYYNSSKCSFYNYASSSQNHEVSIIGWNDNYSKTNFKQTPPGNGAFLVRNSWGPSWGNSGYFWMSYYDKSLGDVTAYSLIQANNNYTKNYQYDLYGLVNCLGYSQNYAFFANKFTVDKANPWIYAASFYTPAINSRYEVWVFNNVSSTLPAVTSGKKGSAVAYATGTIAYPGYHTVTFTKQKLTAGKKFAVVVKLTSPGYNYPIPITYNYAGYTTGCTGTSGQSYISSTGKTWTDIYTYKSYWPKANVCLKAFGKAK